MCSEADTSMDSNQPTNVDFAGAGICCLCHILSPFHCSAAALRRAALHCAALHHITLYCTAVHCTTLKGTCGRPLCYAVCAVPCCAMLCCAVPCRAVLCCAALYCCLPHVCQTVLHRGDTGHRRYPVLSDDEEEEELHDSLHRRPIQQICKADNSLRVWQYKATWNQVPQAEQQP